ncbi:MAG: metallophosphoesterase [Christensenellales bacterium]
MMRSRRKRLLFSPRRKRRPGCLMAFLLVFLVLGVTLSLNGLNNATVGLLRETVTVPALHKGLEGFSILHLSDLHAADLGHQQERIRRLLRTENYRAVCLTGDMVGPSGKVQPLLDLLDIFPDDLPVFLIAGDNDPAPLPLLAHGSAQVKADYILQAEAHGAVYLDSPQSIQVGDAAVWFSPAGLYTTDLDAASFALTQRKAELETGGQADTPDGGAALRAVDYQLDVLRMTSEASLRMKAGDAFVLLSHLPLDAQQIDQLHEGEGPQRRAVNFPGTVCLVLAGHWNDGQWRLPLLGPLWVPGSMRGLDGWLPGNRALSGLAVVHGVSEYVSPGLGASGAYPWQPFRLFNQPRMTLLRLSSTLR